jgi:hypothetical protein
LLNSAFESGFVAWGIFELRRIFGGTVALPYLYWTTLAITVISASKAVVFCIYFFGCMFTVLSSLGNSMTNWLNRREQRALPSYTSQA